ncbi:MAG: glycosyltransferase [Flavobacteriales bacterium]
MAKAILPNTTSVDICKGEDIGKSNLPFNKKRTSIKQTILRFIGKIASNPTDYVVFASTYLLMFGSVFLVFKLEDDFYEFHTNMLSTTIGTIFYIVTLMLLMFKLSFLVFLFFKYLQYKPIDSVSDDDLPSCTVIVPAYNEGKLVYETLMSLNQSDFPKEKLQIISIDDGSKDDTWQWMLKAKEELGDIVSIYQQPQNKGKRHALYRGFNLATGDVFVTVDSDSLVEKDTLRNLVSPLKVNKNCGAVAGNVHVLNTKKALIPKMLNVSFAFSFEFIRAAQSTMGSVLCTPGALAAYRKEAVMGCLDDWMNQTFFGQLTDIGEDRAMTNMILKQGYHVMFQRNALVLTKIPEKFSGLRKMFTRWERSNVRENIMMSRFAFTNFREDSKIGLRILLLNQWLGIITAYPLVISMLYMIAVHPILFLSSTLMGILIFNSIPVVFYAFKHHKSKSFLAHTYGIFYAFSLFWITPYAIVTASRRGWLTRGLTTQ